jgi:hypothetical protein
MRTAEFVKTLRQMTEATAPVAPRAVAAPRVDFETFETVASSQSAVAAAIIKAAATRDAGGPMMQKPSIVAQQILDAGKKRRAED